MTSRLGRIAILTANRTTLLRRHVATLPSTSPLLTKAAPPCQIRKITSTAIAREQYLHSYKDSERYHGNKIMLNCEIV